MAQDTMTSVDDFIEDLTDALLNTMLIQNYDWLGTGTHYPTDEENRAEVREAAVEVVKALYLRGHYELG